jgi:hypothetical protein
VPGTPLSEIVLQNTSSAIAPALLYLLYPYSRVFCPSGHQHETLMFKIVPDDFVSRYSALPVLYPYGASLWLFKIDPVNFVGHFSGLYLP